MVKRLNLKSKGTESVKNAMVLVVLIPMQSRLVQAARVEV